MPSRRAPESREAWPGVPSRKRRYQTGPENVSEEFTIVRGGIAGRGHKGHKNISL